MGDQVFDQFSLLHAASGIIAYFFGLKWWVWLIFHILFEIVENTPQGIHIINKYLKFWPGGKPGPDSFINSAIGDDISAMSGWLLAYIVDNMGEKYGWYDPHIL